MKTKIILSQEVTVVHETEKELKAIMRDFKNWFDRTDSAEPHKYSKVKVAKKEDK